MRKVFAEVLSCALIFGLITGCIPDRDVTTFSIRPQLATVNTTDVTLDFTDLYDNAVDDFGVISESPYGFVYDVQITGSNKDKEIYIYVEVVPEAGANDAKHFVVAILRHLNDAACDQYVDNFEPSSPESFGSLYDYYAVYVNVVRTDDLDTVIFALAKEPGEDIGLDPDMESYEEEWSQHIENYLNNPDPSAAENEGIVVIEQTESDLESTDYDDSTDSTTDDGSTADVDTTSGDEDISTAKGN